MIPESTNSSQGFASLPPGPSQKRVYGNGTQIWFTPSTVPINRGVKSGDDAVYNEPSFNTIVRVSEASTFQASAATSPSSTVCQSSCLAMFLQPLRNFRASGCGGGDAQSKLLQVSILRHKRNAVLLQEQNGACNACTLVAIHKRMVVDEHKQLPTPKAQDL